MKVYHFIYALLQVMDYAILSCRTLKILLALRFDLIIRLLILRLRNADTTG